ncbi:hypothetical protein C8F04DRAFT_956079 [Mycena alexandri]|uniref:Uncharacterized protein n=1 Tax=Mycena alexandri TaxID=1745969 RepID=A0AAD6X4J6_9AGAR|nr:hypothetical protein C8F04DRAFT_956079 [Mycena alexandri]
MDTAVPVFPDDAPEWLTDAVMNLTVTPLGSNFKAVLDAIIRIEGANNFDEGKGLSTSLRPEVVGAWIKGGRGRKAKKIPVIKKLQTYAKDWQAWWDSLQPKWRKRNSHGQWEIGGEYGEDWGTLDCPGVNGLISVAASLYFWGRQLHEAREEKGNAWFEENIQLWDAALNDVSWVLDSFSAFLVA